MTDLTALTPHDLIADTPLHLLLVCDWPHPGRDGHLCVTVQPLNLACCPVGLARAWAPVGPVTVLRHNGVWSSEFASPRADAVAEHDRTGGTR